MITKLTISLRRSFENGKAVALRWPENVDACQEQKSRAFLPPTQQEQSLRLALLRRAFYNQTGVLASHDPNYRANYPSGGPFPTVLTRVFCVSPSPAATSKCGGLFCESFPSFPHE